jgi:hypothetical protein
MIDYTKKTWNSLSSLKSAIERDGKDQVIEFNGYELVTKKWRYGLYDSILVRKPRGKSKS